MRKTKHAGSFFICFLLNLLLNIEWAIPAVVLLALHFAIGISIYFFVGALLLYLLVVFFWMLMMSLANKSGNLRDEAKENKNPYSAKNKEVFKS